MGKEVHVVVIWIVYSVSLGYCNGVYEWSSKYGIIVNYWGFYIIISKWRIIYSNIVNWVITHVSVSNNYAAVHCALQNTYMSSHDNYLNMHTIRHAFTPTSQIRIAAAYVSSTDSVYLISKKLT